MTALFSTQYWLLAQLVRDTRRMTTDSKPGISERLPSYPVSDEQRDKIREIIRDNPLSSDFVPRCMAIVRYVREHGTAMLTHLPLPLASILADHRTAVDDAARSPNKRAYMRYLSGRLDAFLDQTPDPQEPRTSLKYKEQRNLVRLLSDIRALMYFRTLEQRSETGASTGT